MTSNEGCIRVWCSVKQGSHCVMALPLVASSVFDMGRV